MLRNALIRCSLGAMVVLFLSPMNASAQQASVTGQNQQLPFESNGHWKLPVPPDAAPDQKARIEEKNKYGVVWGTPECKGDILINLGGTKMMVPRDTRLEGNEIEYDTEDLRSPKYNCSLRYLENVSRAKFSYELHLTVPPKQPWHLTDFQKDYIAKNKIAGSEEILPDGTKFFETTADDYYVLPLDKAPTFDNIPIRVDCDEHIKTQGKSFLFKTNWCRGSYIHPLGFIVDFSYPRTKYPNMTPLQFDIKNRQRIINLIKKAQIIEDIK